MVGSRFGSPALRGVRFALAIALGAFASLACAAEKWAALSLLGDRISMVYARMQTGTNTNPNEVRAYPTNDAALDNLALRSVVESRVAGVPAIELLALRDPRLYEMQEEFLRADSPLREPVLEAVRRVGVTHLLLLVKARGEAAFPARDGHIGIGRVEGLGFYVDRVTKLRNRDTGMSDVGFLAPFAFYRLVLYDIDAGRFVADERVTASTTYPIAGSDTADPWELMSAEKKTDDLARLLNRNTGGALRRVLAARPRG